MSYIFEGISITALATEPDYSDTSILNSSSSILTSFNWEQLAEGLVLPTKDAAVKALPSKVARILA